MLTLDEAKKYLRVSFDDDDEFLMECINISIAYLKAAITNFELKMSNNEFKAKARLVALALISDMYDKRLLIDESKDISYIVRSLINQMEYGI